MNRRTALISLLVAALLLAGAWLLRPAQSAPLEAGLTVAEALGARAEGYLRAEQPRQFSFPADHGPHEGFRTEWWYYTGNLDTADGRHFGFQLTFFRNALTPEPAQRDSAWATRNVYMAHFALSDPSGERFYAFDRYSRDGAGLAGAQAEPFRVWTESWEATGAPESGTRLRAAQDDIAIDLVARGAKPPVLQGDDGLAKKGEQSGRATYYYSLTRMKTQRHDQHRRRAVRGQRLIVERPRVGQQRARRGPGGLGLVCSTAGRRNRSDVLPAATLGRHR